MIDEWTPSIPLLFNVQCRLCFHNTFDITKHFDTTLKAIHIKKGGLGLLHTLRKLCTSLHTSSQQQHRHFFLAMFTFIHYTPLTISVKRRKVTEQKHSSPIWIIFHWEWWRLCEEWVHRDARTAIFPAKFPCLAAHLWLESWVCNQTLMI